MRLDVRKSVFGGLDSVRLNPACSATGTSNTIKQLHVGNPDVILSRKQITKELKGAQWLNARVLDLRPRGRGFEPYQRHCVAVLEQDTFILAKYWFNLGRPVPV